MKDIDLFGSEIMFRFRGIATHNTKFGSIFTLCILGVIGIRLFFIVKEIFERKTPTVISQERQVDNPALFMINSKSFQVAFGVQDQSYTHYINPRIYTYDMQYQHKKTFIDNDGEAQTVWEVKNVELAPCTMANFDSDITSEFFRKQTYQNLMCLPVDEEYGIQGDFSSPDYSMLMLFLRPCKGSNCEDPEVIEQYLGSAFFAMYFSDAFVDPTEKSDPFHRYARDMFWSTSTSFSQSSSWYLRNNFIESDFGWIYEDITTQYFPSYSSQDISIQPSTSRDFFFQIAIRMEKSKENLFQRKYKNVNSIISEIGGFTQSMLAIGFLICSRLSQLDLNKEIINEAFNFEMINDEAEGVPEEREVENHDLRRHNFGRGIPQHSAAGISQSSKLIRNSEYGGGGGGVEGASPTFDFNGKKQMVHGVMGQDELDLKPRTSCNGLANLNVFSGGTTGSSGKFAQQIDLINSNNNYGNAKNYNNSNQLDSLLSQTQLNLQPQVFMNAQFKPIQIRANNRKLSSSAHVNNESSYLSADLMMTGVNIPSNQTHIRSINETRIDLQTNNFNNNEGVSQFVNQYMDLPKSPLSNNHNNIKLSPTAQQFQQNQNEQKKAESERQFLSFLIQNPRNTSLSQNSSGLYLPDSTMNQQVQPTHLSVFQQHQKQAISSDHEKLQAQQQKLEEKLELQKESDFKRLMHKTTSSMSLNVWEYLKFFLWPFGEVKHKKKIIDYSIDKLYYHLDVLYVVKKLLEVDKLKRILLDQHQLKLFEYIPKPTIRTGITTDENGKEQLNMDIDKHYQDSRSELQKAQEAFVAFKCLNAKQNLNQVDQKILNLLDPRLVDLFEAPFTQLAKNQNGTEPVQAQAQANQFNNPSIINENNNTSLLPKQIQQQQLHQILGTQSNGNQSLGGINPLLTSIQQNKQQYLQNPSSQIEQQNTSAISQFQQINQLPLENNGLQLTKQEPQKLRSQQQPQQQPSPSQRQMIALGNGYGPEFTTNRVFESQKALPSTSIPQNHLVRELSTNQNPVNSQNQNPLSNIIITRGNHTNQNNNIIQGEIEDQESNLNQMINSQVPVNSMGDMILNSPHNIDSNRSMFSEIASDEEKNKSYPQEFGMPDANLIFK